MGDEKGREERALSHGRDDVNRGKRSRDKKRREYEPKSMRVAEDKCTLSKRARDASESFFIVKSVIEDDDVDTCSPDGRPSGGFQHEAGNGVASTRASPNYRAQR